MFKRLYTNLSAQLHSGGGASVKPWDLYAKDGLILQLDFQKGLDTVDCTWLDLISKSKYAEYKGTVSTDDGLVLTSGSISLPPAEGVAYVEICRKVNNTFETAASSSLPETIDDAGSYYAIRAYSAEPSSAVKTQNAAIDDARFNVPADALWLDGGINTLCLDGGDFLCVDH